MTKYSGYNGWKNKETWLVNLWLGDLLESDKEDGAIISADYVREIVEDMVEQMSSSDLKTNMSGLIADLLNCALCEIDYREIAEVYRETEEA
jgi:hypothetical protein